MAELMTTTEVARQTHVCRRTVYRWVDSGKLPALESPGGRRLRFRPEDVAAALRPVRRGEGGQGGDI